MVTITISCPHCGSENVKRNGHASNGKQRYYCKACKKQSRENSTANAYSEERFDIVLLINGIPLVVGEAKTPVRPAVTWVDGAQDLFDRAYGYIKQYY